VRITHARIRGWRSIKDIQLQPGRVTALVGPNNAGKTSILSAFNFLLGDRYPQVQALEDKDFFGKRRDEGVEIAVEFEPGHDLRALTFNSSATYPARDLTARWHDGRNTGITNDSRRAAGLVYLDAARSFDGQFGASRWSLFGQIVRQLNENFRQTVPEQTLVEIQGHLERAQELLKTDLYKAFVAAVSAAFQEQVRLAGHAVEFDFRTFDPLNFYRAMYPTLVEDGEGKNPSEAGSGMRNLIVMALFRAYAKTFRSDSIIAIEEPELYLHPHAQRSLAALFTELAAAGSQIFYSTHSASFLWAERFDEIVLVERRPDEDGDVATQVRWLPEDEMVKRRRSLHPGVALTGASVRDRLAFACGVEQAEAFFSKAVVLVEGETEAAALPVFAEALDFPFDAHGVSVVEASGKSGLDTLHDLYGGFGIPTFVIFDNDEGTRDRGLLDANRTLTRLLGLLETESPSASVGERHAILSPDFEKTLRRELDAFEAGLYDRLEAEARRAYGGARKPSIARHLAKRLAGEGRIPPTIAQIISAVAKMLGAEAREPNRAVETENPDEV